jgi:hypothetical protein
MQNCHQLEAKKLLHIGERTSNQRIIKIRSRHQIQMRADHVIVVHTNVMTTLQIQIHPLIPPELAPAAHEHKDR